MKSANMMIGTTMALLTGIALGVLGVRAQQPPSQPKSSTLTTNWVGYLVAGRLETFDRITRHPAPTVDRQVEIGLRSDGVVIWRETAGQITWREKTEVK